MASRSVSFDVLAIDKASKALGEVAREVTDLDRRISAAGGEIEVDAETAKAAEKLRAIDSQLARLNVKSIKIDGDTDAAQRKLQILRAELEKTTDEGKRLKIEADISQAQNELRRLAAEKVTIDLDTDTLRAKVAAIKSDMDTAKFDVDAGGALAKLEAVQRSVDKIDKRKTTTVDVDAAGAFGALARLGTQLRAAQTPITIVIGVGAVMNALSWVQRLAAGLASLGAVGVVSGGVAAAAFSGVGDAVKAMGEKAETGGGAVTQSASAIRSATRQVEQAQRDLRDANADVTRSEDALADAQKDAVRAVEALDDARKAAIRTLQDYEMRTAGMALSQESADLAIAESRQRLAEVESDGESTALERARAELSVREAIQRRNELEVEGTRLAEDKADADARGVEGSTQVVSAQERIAEANKRVQEAQADLAKSHEGVALAVQRLSDSQLALREAMKPQGGGSSVDKLAEAMDKLSPKQQEFVRFLRGLIDGPLKELQQTSADSFLPGLQDGISSAMDNLGTFKESVAGVGTSFGDFFRDIGPSVGKAVEAFGRLANLGAETTFEGLAGAVNGALDAFTRWANSQSAEKIQGDIREVGQTLVDLKNDAVAIFRTIELAWNLIRFPAQFLSEPTEALEGLESSFSNFGSAIPGLFSDWGSEASAATGPTRELGGASRELTSAQRGMTDAVREAVGLFASQEQASIRYAGQLDQATEAAKRNGETLNIGTAKGRENRQALLDLADAANGVTQKMQEQGAPLDQVRGKYDAQRASLIQVAQQMGLTRTQAQQYIDKLLETPTAKSTTVTANTAAAQQNLKNTQTDITNLKDKTVNIKGNNTQAKSAIDSVRGWLDSLKDKTVNVFTKVIGGIGLSSGGWVPGKPSTVDSIDTKLAPGEFVVRSSAAARWGPLLEQINQGGSPEFANAGSSRRSVSSAAGMAGGVGLAAPIVVNVTVNNAVVGSNDELARVVSTAAREGIERGYLPRGVLTGA